MYEGFSEITCTQIVHNIMQVLLHYMHLHYLILKRVRVKNRKYV